ncbi:ROK family protein [uncultured Alistipes sp.]|jgi:hypothetical protein|uniref:ROK family protein n=1 Tax=uncultured Alistipes sp. TaxID=538949 RepID=UPI0025CE28C3|nr:ROK family protein [uncultured Alistipes sp.]
MDLRTNSCYLLLDVGGTFVKSGAATFTGELLPDAEFSCPIPSSGTKKQIADALAPVIRRGMAFARKRGFAVAGIGIAIPGPFDYANGISRMTHKFQGIYGISLCDMLRELPEVGPDLPIRFMHDVNAVLLGEMFHGNATGYRNVAVVTLGTGLGFSFCRDAEVQYSPMGSPRLPIYNLPYRDGILEDYVSKRGFFHIYQEIIRHKPSAALTVADLGRMAGEGDKAALETFSTVGGILAASVRDLIDEQQIECLLLGGQISRSFAFLEPALREGLKGLPRLGRISSVKHIGCAAFYGLCAYLDAYRKADAACTG